MKKLTKGLGILLASSLVLGLAACGGGSDDKALSTEKSPLEQLQDLTNKSLKKFKN